jgi:hypothetical protein
MLLDAMTSQTTITNRNESLGYQCDFELLVNISPIFGTWELV